MKAQIKEKGKGALTLDPKRGHASDNSHTFMLSVM